MSSEWSINALRRISSNFEALLDGRNICCDALESSLLSLELVYREFVVAESIRVLSLNEQSGLNFIRFALDMLTNVRNRASENTEQSSPPVEYNGLIGRPRFVIPRQQLLYLVENHFTVPQMSEMLGVSVRTLHRRLSQYGLSIRSQYSELTDNDLDRLIKSIHDQFPMCGYRQMNGHLLSQGFRIQQWRIRDSQRRICPEGTMMRQLRCLRRREYRVAAPRSLYHIDGNHKLIR